MKRYFLFFTLLAVSHSGFTQQAEADEYNTDREAVKELVEQFLTAIGNYELDALPGMFCEKANIGGASLRDGKWNTFTMTISEFLEMLRSRSNPQKYTEPVSKFTIHMERGMLAFVKADAVLTRDGKPQSNNFDYFTLLKENGNWKILNGSYVAVPIRTK